jgi:cyclic peptide transporter
MGILMLINHELSGAKIIFIDSSRNNYLIFIALIVVSFISTGLFQNYMVNLTNSIMFKMEMTVVEKVRNASFESFQKLGTEKVYTAIGDTRILSRVPEIFVTLLNSSITIICSFLYFFWVSPLACFTVLGMMIGLVLFYLYRNKHIEKELRRVRDLQDVYFFSLRELLHGFKQVRISWIRNNNLFKKFLLANRTRSKSLSIEISRKYVANELTGVYSWYLVLGVVMFLLPVLFNITHGQLAAFITTILFMMSPVSRLIMVIPFYTALKIAIERIEKVDKQLQVDALPDPEGELPDKTFNSMRFENVQYQYNTEDAASFNIELDNFCISKGEIIFLVGGNGSGKTTFVNLFTGLCRATSGKIYINEKEVDWQEFSAFSNNMAVVYTNQYLFRENYDEHDFSEHNTNISYLEELLNLKGVLKIDHEKDRVNVHLSRGQQKRLSLFLALIENKPIVVLDEWAAEQDPHNKALFYNEWLQEIKSKGKTIIMVSHDDEFYHVADRVVKFSYGKIVSDTNVEVSELVRNIR